MRRRVQSFGFFPIEGREEVIEDVPSSEVDRVAKDFRESGAKEVKVERGQEVSGERYTVRAKW